jgi:excisionase family DNA binding protein
MANLNLEILLTPKEASARLRVTVGTLAVWRSTKRYPLPYVRVGRAIRYRQNEVDAYLRQHSEAR